MSVTLAPTMIAGALTATPSFAAGPSLCADAFDGIRRTMVLDHCKWDPQVGDVAALAPFPLLMSRETWRRLATAAEALADETTGAEQHLLHAPLALHRRLGVPWRLRRLLRRAAKKGVPPTPVRSMRFDFHPTTDGDWRISEVNSDVPGGFTESSSFTRLVARHFPGFAPAGDPAGAYVAALARVAWGPVALLAAPGFIEDQQVTAYLARRLRALNIRAVLASPRQVTWRGGVAHLGGTRVGAVVRFYQAEWLPRLPRRCGWRSFFAGGRTPVTNPAALSLLSESKRFPLCWGDLPFDLPAWRRYLPETRDPRDAPWQDDDAWLLKSAYSNTGDTVTIRTLADRTRWRAVARDVRRHPRDWVAQRRFHTRRLDTPLGPLYPCVGVYVIDGRAAGVYARLARAPVIDYQAIDVALLVEEGNARE